MQVQAYPINYYGDKKPLPLFKTVGEVFILPVGFGPWLDNDLLEAMIFATKSGCQWILLEDKPVLRDEPRWVTL